ncbi:hypothetical protein HMPREF2805_03095 [Streptococcus sp. HMSC034E03]|nr:hypothetical protein HMPREF2805_03095 [Streptococcus sp. HMSC034E03]
MCSMNTRKSIFFSQTSVRIQLHDTKGVKVTVKIGNLTKKVYLFHTDFSPSSTLQVTWIQNVSQISFVYIIYIMCVVYYCLL